MNHYLLLLLAAFAGGAINSVAGGGSFLTFPALLLAGVPAIPANATNNTAMWLGVLASARGYKEEIKTYRRVILPALAISVVGSIGGALLLLHTPPKVFERMIPWLLLFATLVFAISPLLTRNAEDHRVHSPFQLVLQFAVSIYGGYFGAGMGILMLAILSLSSLPNMNAMNGVKNLLSMAINGVAVIPFLIAGVIDWPIALLMAVFSMGGGYAGARFFRTIPSNATRAIVLAIGAGMTAYFFIK
ncbi:MAG TPA: sulfite exporter TauE/SafE family protein [Candidatus Baltobacteraceae bacterium]|nr:sulfite exporter TauE/SafE family protein [Candidatus Baltobacteraceae bacterium]